MRQTITIPLQPLTTVTDVHHGPAVVLSEELLQAIDAWQLIKDEEEANRAAERLQERINEICQQTH